MRLPDGRQVNRKLILLLRCLRTCCCRAAVEPGLVTLNTHKQNPSRGTPDLVVTEETGVIYDLLNETK